MAVVQEQVTYFPWITIYVQISVEDMPWQGILPIFYRTSHKIQLI